MTRREDYMKLGDAQLVEGYRRTKEAGYIEELINRCSPELLAYATKIAGAETAKDVVQDTWMVVMAAIESGRYNEQQQFKKYIKGIAYKLAVKAWGAEHRFELGDENTEEPADDALNEEEELIRTETNATLLDGFRHLNRLEKIVLLFALRGMKFEHIAKKMHIKNARMIYLRAIKKLRINIG